MTTTEKQKIFRIPVTLIENDKGKKERKNGSLRAEKPFSNVGHAINTTATSNFSNT